MNVPLSAPLLTASIVLYKTDPAQLRTAVESVLGSGGDSGLPAALLCVDNSPDRLLQDACEDAGADYLFTGRNLGFGRAHNLAIEHHRAAAAPYHLVVNPDVEFGPDVLPTLYNFMEANPSVGLVMPRVLYPGGQEQHLCKLLPSPLDLLARRFGGRLGSTVFRDRNQRYSLSGCDMSLPHAIPSLSGCFMFLRTSALERVGLFDPRYFMYMEDVDLCRRIGSISATVYYPAVAITHGYAKGSYGNQRLLAHHLASACRYFTKWGWLHDPGRDRANAASLSSEAATFHPPASSFSPAVHATHATAPASATQGSSRERESAMSRTR